MFEYQTTGTCSCLGWMSALPDLLSTLVHPAPCWGGWPCQWATMLAGVRGHRQVERRWRTRCLLPSHDVPSPLILSGVLHHSVLSLTWVGSLSPPSSLGWGWWWHLTVTRPQVVPLLLSLQISQQKCITRFLLGLWVIPHVTSKMKNLQIKITGEKDQWQSYDKNVKIVCCTLFSRRISCEFFSMPLDFTVVTSSLINMTLIIHFKTV